MIMVILMKKDIVAFGLGIKTAFCWLLKRQRFKDRWAAWAYIVASVNSTVEKNAETALFWQAYCTSACSPRAFICSGLLIPLQRRISFVLVVFFILDIFTVAPLFLTLF